MTRILVTGDLHGNRSWYRYLRSRASAFDAVVITGDLIDQGIGDDADWRREAAWVLRWIAHFPSPQTRLFLVTGNHDWWPGDGPLDEGRWLQRARRTGVAVDGDWARLGAWDFFCAPWGDPPPARVDRRFVWIVHTPPARTLLSLTPSGTDGGDELVRLAAVAFPGGGLILSGHVHSPVRHREKVGAFTGFNAGCSVTGAMPAHLVVDFTARSAWRITDGHRQRLGGF